VSTVIIEASAKIVVARKSVNMVDKGIHVRTAVVVESANTVGRGHCVRTVRLVLEGMVTLGHRVHYATHANMSGINTGVRNVKLKDLGTNEGVKTMGKSDYV
jgi:hypothetical protein